MPISTPRIVVRTMPSDGHAQRVEHADPRTPGHSSGSGRRGSASRRCRSRPPAPGSRSRSGCPARACSPACCAPGTRPRPPISSSAMAWYTQPRTTRLRQDHRGLLGGSRAQAELRTGITGSRPPRAGLPTANPAAAGTANRPAALVVISAPAARTSGRPSSTGCWSRAAARSASSGRRCARRSRRSCRRS